MNVMPISKIFEQLQTEINLETLKECYAAGDEKLYKILETMSDEEVIEVESDLTKEDWPKNYEFINFLENYLGTRA